MPEYIIHTWEFKYDPVLTNQAYEQIGEQYIWQCSCDSCKNYKSIRHEIYPVEFISLLNMLGIIPEKEAEIYHIKKIGFKKHLYGGWFHFVGQFTKTNNNNNGMFEIADNFQISFTNKTLMVPDILKKYPILQLDFKTIIPWVIEQNEP